MNCGFHCYSRTKMSCVSNASFSSASHRLQQFAIGKSSQPTSFQHFSDVGNLPVIYGGRGNLRRQYAELPTSQSLAKFQIFYSKSPGSAMKSINGFGGYPDKKKKMMKMEEEEDDDENVGENEEDDEIPEVVFNRMMKRIGFFVGGPIMLGFVFFPMFDFLKYGLKLNIPVWLPLATTFVTFGSSALGIVYGAVSASWDPQEEGSLLGWSELQKNWPQVWKSDEATEL